MQQLLRALGPLAVLVLCLTEEVSEFGVVGLLGVLDVVLVGLAGLQRVVEDADEVVVLVAGCR